LGQPKTFDRLPSTINTILHGFSRVKSSESLQSSRVAECNARRNQVWELQKVKPNTHNRNLTNWFSLHFLCLAFSFGFFERLSAVLAKKKMLHARLTWQTSYSNEFKPPAIRLAELLNFSSSIGNNGKNLGVLFSYEGVI